MVSYVFGTTAKVWNQTLPLDYPTDFVHSILCHTPSCRGSRQAGVSKGQGQVKHDLSGFPAAVLKSNDGGGRRSWAHCLHTRCLSKSTYLLEALLDESRGGSGALAAECSQTGPREHLPHTICEIPITL